MNQYIQTNKNKTYTIRKYNPLLKKIVNYGTYKTLDEALKRKQFLINHNWNIKYSKDNRIKNYDNRYIYLKNGMYEIQKKINGKDYHYGIYATIEEAKIKRDELIKNNWKTSKKFATQKNGTHLKELLKLAKIYEKSKTSKHHTPKFII